MFGWHKKKDFSTSTPISPLSIKTARVYHRRTKKASLSLKNNVYEYLIIHHTGKENMIKNSELRTKFNVNSDKAMRQVIQEIREDKNCKRVVGSVSGRQGGFYICETEEEIQETINNIKHRANQMLRMTHVLEWKAKL